MTTNDYKLYKCNYNELFKSNKTLINDFDDIDTYIINENLIKNTKLTNKYVLYSTITINNNNNNKSIFIIFDLLDSHINDYTIYPTEKLYLNNLSNKENKDYQNKYLSLQSIIFFSKGSIASDNTSEYNTGHYTCLFKCNNKWYYYNDNSLNVITEYEINLPLKDIIKNYYYHLLIRMLYYIAE